MTLSIGVAQIDDTFAKQYDEAQVSLDLALGRGGDQAIVRIGKDTPLYFYLLHHHQTLYFAACSSI